MNKINKVQCNIAMSDELYKQIKQTALDQDLTIRAWMHKAIIEYLAYETEQKKKYE